MKKMDKDRDGVYYENMVQAAYKKRCFGRLRVKKNEDVRIQQHTQQADQKKKNIHGCFGPAQECQNRQAKETCKRQDGGNAVQGHAHHFRKYPANCKTDLIGIKYGVLVGME
jgi:hypothetical protein